MRPYILLYLILSLLSLSSCEKKVTTAFRSMISEANYNENNEAAAIRLYSIMYNASENASAVERFKVVHISDAHVSAHSSSNDYKKPNNLLEAVRFSNQLELGINAIVVTGDHIDYDKKQSALQSLHSFYRHLYENNNVPSFPCHGNHDSNIMENYFSNALYKQELHDAFDNRRNHELNREAGENYYYTDLKNPMGGSVRIIALDMLDQPALEYNTLYSAVFSQKQIDWLCNKALKEGMTDGHHVIIITHYPFEALSKTERSYLIDGNFAYPSRMVPEIVEAFRDRKQINERYVNLVNGIDTISVNADFSGAKGDFICYMGGHAHFTYQFEISNIRNKSTAFPPQKMLLCTNMSPSEQGKTFNRVNRKAGSLSDNSFCIYAIDTRERKIYVTFFGAYLPSDKSEEEYPDVQVVSY